ncbi:hypothetical protein [Candidatus Wolbachia massiliensis]|uniref:hypothetical protein n=1 Tax=Candidatus Wolbachia massiliensis TaxID=1845000 RepID=UPI001CD060A6|nr:hypothetical protein [Candidatus Wolbachia massiliensis]
MGRTLANNEQQRDSVNTEEIATDNEQPRNGLVHKLAIRKPPQPSSKTKSYLTNLSHSIIMIVRFVSDLQIS